MGDWRAYFFVAWVRGEDHGNGGFELGLDEPVEF